MKKDMKKGRENRRHEIAPPLVPPPEALYENFGAQIIRAQEFESIFQGQKRYPKELVLQRFCRTFG